VREALSQLVLDGLVRATPNKSIIVLGIDDQDILDLYEVRGVLETLAASKAAARMTEEQKWALREALDIEKQATGDRNAVEILQNMDSTFHDIIFQGTGSKILRNILSPINIYTRYARSFSLASPGRSQLVVEEHSRICDAIINGDCQAAGERMQEHIARSFANFQAIRIKGGQNHD